MKLDRNIIVALCVLILVVTVAAAGAYMGSDDIQEEARQVETSHKNDQKSSNDNIQMVQWDNV